MTVRQIVDRDSKMKRNAGFTLIELMIALVLGLFVVGVTISVYTLVARGSSETVKSARLNHDMQMAMSVMVNDIRRAGYWGGAVIESNAEDNPFMDATTVLQRPSSTCILYSYDGDNGDGVVDGTEYYGFKLNGTTISIRLSGSTTADCTDGTWSTLTDSDEINVTALTFTLTSACKNITDEDTSCTGTDDKIIEQREVTISMTAQLVDDSSVSKTLTSDVIVRNDNIFTGT